MKHKPTLNDMVEAAHKAGVKVTASLEPEYEKEVHTSGYWWLEHFNEDYWSILGWLKTPSDGDRRDEVMGVASLSEAGRIVTAHNAEIKELLGIIETLRKKQ